MSQDYCLTGVDSTLEIGKGNALLKAEGTGLSVRDNADSAYATLKIADPVDAQDAATKTYVDGLVNGLTWKDYVDACTTGALPANTAGGGGSTLTADANGALPAQDGITLTVGESLLVKDEVNAVNRGIYEVTDVGSAGTPWVLTRRADAAVGSDATQATVFCAQGTVGADTVHTQVAEGNFGVVAQTWVLIASTTAGINAIADAAPGDVSLIVSGVGPTATLRALDNTATITFSVNVDGALQAVINATSIGTGLIEDGAITAVKIADDAIEGGRQFKKLAVMEHRYVSFSFGVTTFPVELEGPNAPTNTLETNTAYLVKDYLVGITQAFDGDAALVLQKQNPLTDGGLPTTLLAANKIAEAKVGVSRCADAVQLGASGTWKFQMDLTQTTTTQGAGYALVNFLKC